MRLASDIGKEKDMRRDFAKEEVLQLCEMLLWGWIKSRKCSDFWFGKLKAPTDFGKRNKVEFMWLWYFGDYSIAWMDGKEGVIVNLANFKRYYNIGRK